MNLDKFELVIESHTVEKIVEVVWEHRDGQTDRYRIESLRNHKTGKYSASVYREIDVNLQRADMDDDGPTRTSHERIWVDARFPWTERDTADGAIEQCLSLIE